MLENTEGAIKKDNPENWQHRVHKTKKSKTTTLHDMCRTPQYANKRK